jgi:Asp-tRNA(Asn)/Glu-tRNA(Gln) amidotransferase A subunit family amidase
VVFLVALGTRLLAADPVMFRGGPAHLGVYESAAPTLSVLKWKFKTEGRIVSTPVVTAEAAAAFDDLTRTGKDKLLTSQKDYDWPNTFRIARFIPAVEYIQAARARTLVMESMAKVFDGVDVIVSPTNGGSDQLTITNLTGHPAVILPNGLRGPDAPKFPFDDPSDFQNAGGPDTPTSLTFLGKLYGEAELLAFARAYQEATGFHLQHPKMIS